MYGASTSRGTRLGPDGPLPFSILHEMTEAAARAALRAWRGADGLEGWIAEQPWRTILTRLEHLELLRC
jgi:hypothetical protein